MAKKALVTIAIGDFHHRLWEQLFKPTWQAYADKHGYDLILFTDFLDSSPKASERRPHWQKCLILEQEEVRRYDRVVWMDSDIGINIASPCIVDSCPEDKIGVVSYNAVLDTPGGRDNLVARAKLIFNQVTPSVHQRYIGAKLPPTVDDWTNTGVIVFTPARHRDLLRGVYENGVETPDSLADNMALSHAIFSSGQHHLLDPRFNCDIYYKILEHYPFLTIDAYNANEMLRALVANIIWHNNFFLHYTTGINQEMRGDARFILEDQDLLMAMKYLFVSGKQAGLIG